MRTVFWENNSLHLIDQRKLPGSLVIVSIRTHIEAVNAIKEMLVRGAPAIGATAAFGMALAAREIHTRSVPAFRSKMNEAGSALINSRPTAINLTWAVQRILEKIQNPGEPMEILREKILLEAQYIADEDVEACKQMDIWGAELIQDGDTIIHHCNTGSLAVVEGGTALGAIRTAHEHGKKIHVLVDETRPRLQGGRLTAWELQQYGIPFDIITDNMAGYFLQKGLVDKVFYGADRIAVNGDVVNKIGSYMLALAAKDNQVPVYVVAPLITVDFSSTSGDAIPIEERNPDEVLGLQYKGEQVFPTGSHARNPAFDITPNRLVTAIVTEIGIVRPPFLNNLVSFRKKVST